MLPSFSCCCCCCCAWPSCWAWICCLVSPLFCSLPLYILTAAKGPQRIQTKRAAHPSSTRCGWTQSAKYGRERPRAISSPKVRSCWSLHHTNGQKRLALCPRELTGAVQLLTRHMDVVAAVRTHARPPTSVVSARLPLDRACRARHTTARGPCAQCLNLLWMALHAGG